MDILPVTFYEYLFLFLLCFVSFLIGWFSQRKRNSPTVINEPPKTDTNIGITAQKKTLRAVQTRRRGGEAVISSSTQHPEQAYNSPPLGKPEGADDASGAGEITITPEKKDDLKQINGIGPAIEKKLNKIGIYTLLQISKFTRKDIEKVAKDLGSFPKKIEKENWVQQAQKLRDNSE